jgi:hypothetical protein
MPRTYRVKCRVASKDILYLNSTVDSYEGLGLVRTISSDRSQVIIYSTEDTYEKVIGVLNALIEEGMDIKDIHYDISEDVDQW